ncbi:MAG: molybdopterin molybdotransferase MoeA [Gaiellaceae bacterium]
MTELISLEEAQKLVVGAIGPISAERVPIERAAGRVLAEPAAAVLDLPPFANSAMDGFAVRAADATEGARLTVVAESAAGSPSATGVEPATAVQISTGAAIPPGADAIVPVEHAAASAGEITVNVPAEPGAHVRARGTDVSGGDTVLAPGTLIGPAQVGALAAAGLSEVQCAKRPRVGIVVTGSELRAPGTPLADGELYESNGLMLAAQLVGAGAVPAQLGVVSDDADEHERTLEKALLGFDMVVTSGGASVGPHDLVRDVQRTLRVEEIFHGVAIKPGKPVTFGVRKKHHIFNLPGNPVSALVCFELLVRPAIGALLGARDVLPRFERCTLGTSIGRLEAREQFVRARIGAPGANGQRVAEPLGSQGSHMIVSAAHADGLVRISRGDGAVEAGAEVSYLPLA